MYKERLQELKSSFISQRRQLKHGQDDCYGYLTFIRKDSPATNHVLVAKWKDCFFFKYLKTPVLFFIHKYYTIN